MEDSNDSANTGVPKEQDPMMDVLQGYIFDKQSTDFDFFSISFGLSIRPLWRLANADGARNDGCGRLCMVTWPDGTLDTVRFRRCPSTTLDSENPHITHIQIQHRKRGRWDSAFNWLQARFKTKLVGNGTQQEWWDNNGKFFPLMKLPKELRCCIYDSVFGPYIWPSVKTVTTSDNTQGQDLVVLNGGSRTGVHAYDPLGKSSPIMSKLIYLNKVVSEEARRVAWEGTTKHFNNVSNMTRVLSRKTPPGAFNHLNRVSLGLYNNEYIELLGMHPTMTNGFEKSLGDSPAAITIFRNIPSLNHLHFKFTMRTKPSDERDPWAWMANYEEATCQKVFVDWFFTFALEHIRYVPQVTFSGDVKNSTRTKWEEIFREERRGASQYNTTKLIKKIKKKKVTELPPPCHCPTPCHWWKVYGPLPEYYDSYERRVFKCED